LKKIILDLDGVLVSWHEAVYDDYTRRDKFKGSFREFWIDYIPSLSKELQKYIVEIPIYYAANSPSKEVLNFLNKIKESYEIYYVTSRPESVRLTTEQYLRRYKFPYKENLIFTDDKSSVARILKVDFALDDFSSHIEKLSKVTTAILFAKPWNKDSWDKYPTARTFFDVLEFMEVR
jgi:uncharacterized HAD superfamily protein